MKSRIVFIFLVFSGIWGLLVARGARLQLLPDERLHQLKQRQYETTVLINSRRGAIYDRNGKELAVTVPTHSLFADPQLIDSPRRLAKTLSKRLRMDERELYRRFKFKERRFVWLKRHLPESDSQWVRQLGERGLGLIEEPKRVYPGGRLLSQVLGFVGSEDTGLEGLELQFDSRLHGEPRRLILPRDARGRPLLEDARQLTDVPDGADLHLTVDSELQFIMENELEAARMKYSADGAMGVVLDAQTSAILAMAGVPDFDSNASVQTPAERRRNRVVADVFEPGSTLKTFVIAKALKDGLIKPNTRFNCEGGKLKIGDRWIKEAEASHKFEWLTVSEILAFSSNVGMAKIAFKMGDERVLEGLREFGFTDRTGVELPGEARGIIAKPPWRPHLLSNISFGHGIAVSPLQLAAAYAAIANGGVWRKPYLVEAIVSDQKGAEKITDRESRRVLTPIESTTMVHMLASATDSLGTGFHARIPGYPVAGKTGTAQKVDLQKGGYRKGEYISSFAGFVPAHAPKFVIYVALDNPKKDYYGAQVAAPLFARVAQFAVRRAGLVPVLISERDIVPKKKTIRSNLQAKAIADLKGSQPLAPGVVPDLSGLSLREALRRAKSLGLRMDIQGSGVVVATEPRSGEEIPNSKRLRVTLAPREP